MLSHDLARELLSRRNNDVRIQVLTDAGDEGFRNQLVELRDQDPTIGPEYRTDPVVTYDPYAEAVVVRAGVVTSGDGLPLATWLEQAVEKFGQPHVDLGHGVNIVTSFRRCWIFNVDGQNFNLAIDEMRDGPARFEVHANSPGHQAKLFLDTEPTDAQLHSICEFAWPGYRSGR